MDTRIVNNLIYRISQSDDFALEELYNISSGKLFAVAFNILKDRFLAEDVLQEVYLQVVKNAKTLIRYENGSGMLITMTKNVALNMYKKRARKREVGYDNINIFGDSVDNYGRRNDVKRALKCLPPPQPEIIRLKYYADMTIREIAKFLKLSKSTVQREIAKAENALKKLLKEYL